MSPTCSEASSRGALLELLAALVGLDAGLEQVLEDEEHDGRETDGADAEALVAERDAGREQAGRELRRQHGEVDGLEALAERHLARTRAASPATITKLRKFVTMNTTQDEAGEDQRVLRRPERPPRPSLDDQRADQRERGPDREVHQVPMPRAGARRAASISGRRGADGGSGRRTEQRHRENEREERARDPDPRNSIVSTSLPTASTSRSRTSSIGAQSRASEVATATSAARTSISEVTCQR